MDESTPVLPLFRRQVLAEQQAKWLGTVLLAPRISHRLFTIFALAAAAGLLALLFFGQYTRTSRVSGWLVPESGLGRVSAPRAGSVIQVLVAEGQHVKRGAPLVTLSDDVQTAALGATQDEVARSIEERKRSLVEERTRQGKLAGQQEESLRERIQSIGGELRHLDEQVALLASRVQIARRTEALHEDLRKQGFISEMRVQQVVSDRLDQTARLAELKRARAAKQSQRAALESELRELPLKSDREIAASTRDIARLQQDRAEAESRREIVLAAPHDGVVTAITAVPGTRAPAGQQLLSVLPEGTILQAQLFSPSRAIGFVRPGQPVLLRYQAYPFQKFGHQEGRVEQVSRSPLNVNELPSGLPGGVGSAKGAEPLYRISVALANQSLDLQGRKLPLQPGMLLEADVSLETRRLYEWILDPLYSVSSTWQ